MKNNIYKDKYKKYKLKYLKLKGGAAFRNHGDSKLPEQKDKSVREITLTNITKNKDMIIDIFRILKGNTLIEQDILHISKFDSAINNDNLDDAVKSIEYMLTFINTINSNNEKKILFVGFQPKEVINISIDDSTFSNHLNAQFKFFYDGNFFYPEHWKNLNETKFDYIIFDHGMHWNESGDKREFPSIMIWSHLKDGGKIITPKVSSDSEFFKLNQEFQLFQLIEEKFVDPVTRVNLVTHNRIYFNVYQKISQNF